jgi:hypothetical protein
MLATPVRCRRGGAGQGVGEGELSGQQLPLYWGEHYNRRMSQAMANQSRRALGLRLIREFLPEEATAAFRLAEDGA